MVSYIIDSRGAREFHMIATRYSLAHEPPSWRSLWISNQRTLNYKNACAPNAIILGFTYILIFLTVFRCSKLIREMTSIIDPADDYLTITAAEEQMKMNYAKAKKENEEAYADLKGERNTLHRH